MDDIIQWTSFTVAETKKCKILRMGGIGIKILICIYILIAILIFEHGKEGMEFQILSRVSNSIEFLFWTPERLLLREMNRAAGVISFLVHAEKNLLYGKFHEQV